MTTAAMVFGVVPLVIASGAGAAGRQAMGLVIFTGMSIGTLFTLFVVPAFYMLIGSNHEKERRRGRGGGRRGAQGRRRDDAQAGALSLRLSSLEGPMRCASGPFALFRRESVHTLPEVGLASARIAPNSLPENRIAESRSGQGPDAGPDKGSASGHLPVRDDGISPSSMSRRELEDARHLRGGAQRLAVSPAQRGRREK